MKDETAVSLAVYNRMPMYLKILRELKAQGLQYVSSVAIADLVHINASVVKNDLSYAIKSVGKPKLGYETASLIEDIEEFLGYNNSKDAILVGTGKLGQALMGYEGFTAYGLNIIAGFDIDDKNIGREINGKKILPTGKLESAIKKLNIKIAILTIPQAHAQEMTDMLVKAGIRAIWNFTPAHIKVPENVAIRNENMAASLAILSQQLKEILQKESN